ncbi:MAG: GNAT family N-acetyltransferase [Pseudomonadota bacterium]
MTRLETERLVLRKPVLSDYPTYEAFVIDDRSEHAREFGTKGEAYRVFCSMVGHWAMHGTGYFAITRRGDDAPIGGTGVFHPPDFPEGELGYSLWTAEAEGQGIAAEAVTAVRGHVYRDLGWPTIVSYINPENARSIALAERIGCVLDEAAGKPEGCPDDLVYRHPGPEALQ